MLLDHTRPNTGRARKPAAEPAGDPQAEFRQATVFRPSRDIRFSPDSSPYKTIKAHSPSGFLPGSTFMFQQTYR
jgi:Conserved hypothetical protein (DUF2461)